MREDNAIVAVRSLSKRFGRIQALDKVDLTVSRGRIIGLLGANGAGKSTLLRHMIGLYLGDAGHCTTFGCDAAKLGPGELSRIGYVHQEGELLGWMTVGQLIRYVSAYYSNWNRELEEEYIEDFDIDVKDRVGSLSPGQRQKLSILLAIGFEPELLILDEPASTLDPIARSRFLDLLLEIIQDENRTIIISSHILSDVEKVIDHTVIMSEGKIVRDCSFDDLREEYVKVTLTS
jgi:ABC-2 type transport system ATP-binding protein